MSDVTRYAFREGISGFFELPVENARRIVPPHLQPVELHHGTGILSVMIVDFTDTPVGAYGEIVMSVIVAPFIRNGERLPNAAAFPFMVGTTTRAAREHLIERWHLPHWMEDVEVSFEHGDRTVSARVAIGGAPAVDLTVEEHTWGEASHLYQCFTMTEDRAWMAHFTLAGPESQHEEELGSLRLHDHPFNGKLQGADVGDIPVREIWMKDSVQSFEPLRELHVA